MFLDSNKKLVAVLTAAKTTLNLPVMVDYVDLTSTTTSIGQFPSYTNGTTAVDILTAPTVPAIRKINGLTIYGRDTAAKTVRIYTIDSTPTTGLITAGAFVAGNDYQIVSVGTTDFTLIGASANTVGVIFTATGVGTGTGTAATAYQIIDMTLQIDDTLIYTDTNGLKVLDVSGQTKMSMPGYALLAGSSTQNFATQDLTTRYLSSTVSVTNASLTTEVNQSNATFIATANGAYSGNAQRGFVYSQVTTGITNSGALTAGYDTALRNFTLTGDTGTLTILQGRVSQYGHLNQDASTPTTTNAYGYVLSPFRMTGTITNMYDLYLAVDTGAGTVTNRWGLYQANTGNNALAGKLRVGGTTAPVATLDVTGNIVASTLIRTGGYTVATLPAGTQGDRTYVTDALAPAWGTAVTGGGAVVSPVFRNATVWISA